LTGIGEALRQARIALGLDLQQAAEATNIRARYLDDLESERFDRLPAPVYARSFLREYADLLGLDGDLLVARYDEAHRELVWPEMVLGPGVPRRRRIVPGPSAAVAVALGLGALTLWALGQGGSAPNPLTGSPDRTAPSTTAARAARTVHHEAPPERAAVVVLSAAHGDCWLAARIGSRGGPIAYEGFLRRGRTLRLGLARTLWLRLGAPWNVDLRVAGRNATLAAGSRPVNVIVSRRGIRRAT